MGVRTQKTYREAKRLADLEQRKSGVVGISPDNFLAIKAEIVANRLCLYPDMVYNWMVRTGKGIKEVATTDYGKLVDEMIESNGEAPKGETI